jgi:hypothetical protein
MLELSSDFVAAIVRQHRMHYDVAPVHHVDRDGTRRRVGFELHLWGVPPPGVPVQPGCPACRAVHARMEQVARMAIRDGGGPLDWRIGPFAPALYWSPAEPRDEVSLVATGVATDYARGACAEAEEELRGIRERLHAWGACEGRWRETPPEELDRERRRLAAGG